MNCCLCRSREEWDGLRLSVFSRLQMIRGQFYQKGMSTHKSSPPPIPWGSKLTGFILESNLLLGLSFHFLNAVQANAMSTTPDATAMMMMNVVLGRPPIFSSL